MAAICQLNRVRKTYGGRVVLDDVTLGVLPGAKIGVVGPNGAGKSTLLALMAGREQPSAGEVVRTAGTTVGVLTQEPRLDDARTVLGNVRDGVADTLALLKQFEQISQRLAVDDGDDLLAELGRLQEQIDERGGWDLDSRLGQAMHALRCPPGDTPVAVLSGGERRRVALCRLLVRQPDLLLLDEPTNHLDAESVQWLEQHLATYPGTVVAVTHDRYFLDNVAEWIAEVDRGRVHGYRGNYCTYLEAKAARMAVEGAKDAKRRKRLADELAWARSPAAARQAAGRARLRRYAELATRAETARRLDFTEIQIPPGPRLGRLVIEAEHLSKGYAGRPLIADLSFTLPPGGIVGVIGPNGVGKTTLLKMLVGEETPDAGSIRVGDSVRMSYVDQPRAGIDPDATVWELVSGGHDVIAIGTTAVPSRAYVAAFGFKGADQQKPARMFSGGERSRLNLALTLKQGGNLLLLDEPTNDLDVDTLASLEHALLEFPGCAVITAHDRWLLDRVATHILAWEGDDEHPGRWLWFEGNFDAYARNKVDRLGPDADRAGRLAHRKLVRG